MAKLSMMETTVPMLLSLQPIQFRSAVKRWWFKNICPIASYSVYDLSLCSVCAHLKIYTLISIYPTHIHTNCIIYIMRWQQKQRGEVDVYVSVPHRHALFFKKTDWSRNTCAHVCVCVCPCTPMQAQTSQYMWHTCIAPHGNILNQISRYCWLDEI